jgi:hypothetical protein
MNSGNDVGECAYLTKQAGDNVFGISQGLCMSGKNVAYDAAGKLENCNPRGGEWANQVYTLPGYTPPPPFTGEYKMTQGVESGGNIQCFTGHGTDMCKETCNENPQCKAYIAFGNNCCTKNKAFPTFKNPNVNEFYEKIGKGAIAPQPPVQTSYKGCFKDGQPRTIPDNVIPTNDLQTCSRIAKKRGDNVIGLQNGSECRTGKNSTYDRLGPAGDCPPGGRAWTNQVYTLDGYQGPKTPTPPDANGFAQLPRNPQLLQNSKIGVIAGTTKNFILSFDITPKRIIGGFSNILRFTYTDDNNCCNPGDRSPAIWFGPGSTRLYCVIGDTSDGNWLIETDALPLNKTSTVTITCRDNTPTVQVKDIGTFRGTQPSGRVDPAGRPLHVYAGDKFYPAASATLANLSYQVL